MTGWHGNRCFPFSGAFLDEPRSQFFPRCSSEFSRVRGALHFRMPLS
ncbi:hypothetical protein [Burkholderia ubonensis]|nr:hypothetical protein [Burkholderia ubonensis]